MPFIVQPEKICDSCPHGRCIEDVRSRRIGNRDTKFRLSQGSGIACTFDAFAPGSDFDPEPGRTFDEYIRRFTANLRAAGNHFYGGDFGVVKAGAFSKVEGDLFELLEATAIWNAISAWNRFMHSGTWESKAFVAPEWAVPTPMRKVAVVQLPRGYDSTKLFKAETRAALAAFEHALSEHNSELKLSCPDIVGVRLPEEIPSELEVFMNPISDLGANSQRTLAEAFKLLVGRLDGRSLLFAIAAKRSVRSDRLYQPLFEANVLKFLIGEVLHGSSFRFHVHVGSPEGADVEGHYRAASLVSLLRGGHPTRAVDKLYHAISPRDTAQIVLNDLPLFPL